MFILIFVLLLLCAAPILAVEKPDNALTIPAFTAYIEPRADGARVDKNGVSNWTDAAQTVNWCGNIQTPGLLTPLVELTLPQGETATMRLSVAGQSRVFRVENAAGGVCVLMAPVLITQPGYHKFTLEGLEKSGAAFPQIQSLLLAGPATQKAHFNLKERRNAASVHWGYPIADEWKVEAFYNEVTALAEPLHSFYMACGFSRGYFGMQVNSPTERRIIFSIWDSGNEAIDRNKVGADDRVRLLAKGEGVYAGDFGNEGTGGHSHLKYQWKTGETYRFLVTVQPDGTFTTYNGYFFFPETQKWGLIASFRAPKDGKYLRGLYSFNENFWGNNGHLRRLALFGPQWVKTSDGQWHELTTARFTHDVTGKDDRHDYNGGALGSRFYLSNGGFTNDPQTAYRAEFKREATGKAPQIVLPEK
jgi:hypothetical protein